MTSWCPQEYKKTGQQNGVDDKVISNAIQIGDAITSYNQNLPPIFTLRHLSHLADVHYTYLRKIVSRSEIDSYRCFRIPKDDLIASHKGFRIICVPDIPLLKTQKWITRNILSHIKAHNSSVAYSKNSNIYRAAKLHCGSRWLIKLDVKRFFESISEINVHNVFRQIGYEPLLAFEFGRICTRLGKITNFYNRHCWRQHGYKQRYLKISSYDNLELGHLPQGAPTSPMLSNLAMKNFDKRLSLIARNNDLFYTRYADDICLSSFDKNFSRAKASKIISEIYSLLWKHGLSPNTTKTRVSPPGSRKIVLGLLVNENEPRLTKAFKSRLRMHFYYLTHSKIGPSKHAQNRGFSTVWGLRNHIQGLLSYANQIEPNYAKSYFQIMQQICWPF